MNVEGGDTYDTTNLHRCSSEVIKMRKKDAQVDDELKAGVVIRPGVILIPDTSLSNVRMRVFALK